jgi:hypothetical protein
MNTDTKPSVPNKTFRRIIYLLLSATILLIGIVAFRNITGYERSSLSSVISVGDNKDMSGINEFKLEQDIQTQTLKDIDIEERSTDVKVTYPDGHTFIIDSDYIEPVTDISKIDINFDGVQDVRVDLSMGAYNMGTDFYIQDPKTRTFAYYNLTRRDMNTEGDIFPGLGFVSVDTETKTLSSYFKGRGVGDIFTNEQYRFVDGAWHIASREFQDNYEVKWMSYGDGWSPYYINEVIDYTKNPSATTTTYLELKTIGDQFGFIKIERPGGEK